ncbi:MAG: aldo/keto reductase [Bacillota bacterium]|jgi:predicted aldo/keto reductase-like oxidoreductase
MKKVVLGQSGIEVSELCFGTLPMGPLQSNLPLQEGTDLLVEAIEKGVNFFDSAQLYKSYPYLHAAMKKTGRKDLVISSKSVNKDYQGMEEAILEALKDLDRDYLDIFFLHAPQSGADLFTEWEGAWQCLKDYKAKGYLRAIGAACHKPAAVLAAADERDIDIVFPLINMLGWGYTDGSTVDDMLKAIARAHKQRKGMYAMKVFAGGHLVSRMPEAIKFVQDIPGMEALSIGLINKKELDVQLRIFNGEDLSSEEVASFINTKQLLVLPFCCTGCGNCVKICGSNAMEIIDEKAVPIAENCVLCGYCVPACPEFAIRMR